MPEGKQFNIDPNYMEVSERIAEFRERYPEGSLRPVDQAHPYDIITVADHMFVVYVAAAYRHPNDALPGIGVAWEPFPGRTSFTKDSELQNAETSAWGRAIIASLASSSKKVASANEVRNRQADQDEQPSRPTGRRPPPVTQPPEALEQIAHIRRRLEALDPDSVRWAREMAKEDGIPKLEVANPGQLNRISAILQLAENASLPFEETEA